MAASEPPLHLRCGDDLRERLPRAGIAGLGNLRFADPVCYGPARVALTPHGAVVLQGRARRIPARRWLGGVVVGPASPWRWDPVADEVAKLA